MNNLISHQEENIQNYEEQSFYEWLNSEELKEHGYIETFKNLSEDFCDKTGNPIADVSLSNIIYQIEETFLELAEKKKITDKQRDSMSKSRNKLFGELETKVLEIKKPLDEILAILETRRWNKQTERKLFNALIIEQYKNDPKRPSIAMVNYWTEEEITKKFEITDEDKLVDFLVQCYFEGSKQVEWENHPYFFNFYSFRERLLGEASKKLHYDMETIKNVYAKINEKVKIPADILEIDNVDL